MSLSSYDSGYSSVGRLEHFRTQHELARNFYDDVDFCPLTSFEEVAAHRSRIQQRSPYSSPRSSPPVSYNSTASPPKRRAIPIINPENMAPVAVLQQQRQRQQYQQHYNQQESNQMAYWQTYNQERPSSASSSSSYSSSASSSASASSSSLLPSMLNSHVIPIINPSTGQALLHHPMYDVTVR